MGAKEIVKKTGASAVGAGTSVGAVALAGIPGLSGPGIMTALATLGLGSAAIGIASVVTLLCTGYWEIKRDVVEKLKENRFGGN